MTEPDRVDVIEHVQDHVDQGLASFYRILRGKPLVAALAHSYLQPIQDAEDAAWSLFGETIEDALGVGLDRLGILVGLPRGGVSDDETYRRLIKAMVRAHRSSGTGADMIDVASLAFDTAGYTARMGYSSILFEPSAPLGYDGRSLWFVLNVAKMGGVQLELIDPPAAQSNLFTFSDDWLSSQSDAARGFADTTQLAGGQLTGVIA